ncbi:MAG: hypothetical protein HGB29_06845 [Chlorobiaceae bacterium]|nr:hypothetical protein [Chlorobiaceae bacterium]
MNVSSPDHSSGIDHTSGYGTCSSCQGRGRVNVMIKKECPVCEGTSTVLGRPCAKCNGTTPVFEVEVERLCLDCLGTAFSQDRVHGIRRR